MSMDEFMRSLSDQQKAMFMKALQDSGTPPEEEVTGDEDDSKWTTTMPPHIKEEYANKKPEPSNRNPSMDEFMMRQQKSSGRVQSTGINTFTDDGSCRGEETKTPNYKPSPRTRKAPKKVDVRCHACGKTFKKLETLIQSDYHRCDRCCGG